MVFLNAPHIIGDSELKSHIAQVLMIADDARNVNHKLSSFPASQQVVEAMAHLAHKNRHARLHVVEIKIERNSVALCVESRDVFLNLVTWNQEVVEFPFYTHKKHRVNRVNILVQVNDVSFIICDKLCYL